MAALVLAASTKRWMSRLPRLDAVGVEQVHAFFDAGDAVGDLGEGVAAEEFLFGVEGAVVGADGVDEAGVQGIPEDVF